MKDNSVKMILQMATELMVAKKAGNTWLIRRSMICIIGSSIFPRL